MPPYLGDLDPPPFGARCRLFELSLASYQLAWPPRISFTPLNYPFPLSKAVLAMDCKQTHALIAFRMPEKVRAIETRSGRVIFR
jgi:hypothetical protein